MSTYSIALSIPSTSTRALAWWKEDARDILRSLVARDMRQPHGATRYTLTRGNPSTLIATVDTRPIRGAQA